MAGLTESTVEMAALAWRHFRITLKPSNPDFEAIELTVDDEGEFTVIAEFLEVVV